MYTFIKCAHTHRYNIFKIINNYRESVLLFYQTKYVGKVRCQFFQLLMLRYKNIPKCYSIYSSIQVSNTAAYTHSQLQFTKRKIPQKISKKIYLKKLTFKQLVFSIVIIYILYKAGICNRLINTMLNIKYLMEILPLKRQKFEY